MDEKKYIILEIIPTAVDPKKGEIAQLSALKLNGLNLIDRFDYRLNDDKIKIEDIKNMISYDKDSFNYVDSKEEIQFFVVEETQINGTRYLFVTEEEDGDCDAYILKEVQAENDEVIYAMVDEDVELEAISKVFAEMLDDVDLEY